MKIKKGDHVVVTSGKDKGATGTVIAAFPKQNRVLVQGVNMVRKNTKVTNRATTGTGTKEGGIVTQEASIHVSNVQLVDPESKRPARVGYKVNDEGVKVRVLRPSGKEI
jgi:large subunit ribosomal protein L24